MTTHYEVGSDYSEKYCDAMDDGDTTRDLSEVDCPNCLKRLRHKLRRRTASPDPKGGAK